MAHIRFLIIGTGHISERFCSAAELVSGVTVAAVYSRNLCTGKTFRDKFGIKKVYDCLDRALLDKDIDAVYVASPTFLHCSHSVMAMKAGKHVLCEKSIASSLDELDTMLKAAKENSRVLLEAMRPAYDSALEIIRDAIGKIGSIRRADLHFCKYSTRYDNFKKGIVENAFDPTIRNSALSDIGVYPLWLALALFGEPTGISSDKVFLHNGFLASGCSVLSYGDKTVTVSYSKITEEATPSLIEGEDGTLIIDKVSAPRSLCIKNRNGTETVLPYTPCENNMIFEIAAFRDMILGVRSNDEDLSLSRLVMNIADKIHKH